MSLNLNEYRVFGDTYKHFDTLQSRWPRRLFIFLSVFLPLFLVTQTYVFLQPAVYVSEASVLTTAATDIDQASPNADLQHVSIQKQLLLGQPILDKTLETLQKQDSAEHWSSDALRTMFAVVPVVDTNLLKLVAEGSQPRALQHAVNAWLEAYRQARADYVAEISEKVTNTLNDELTRIELQINDKRRDINEFRLKHDILSVESADNLAHARLQGLNQSLNKALEEEVKAEARMDALHNSIAQGKTVVPDSDSKALAVMIEQAERLREKLEGLRSRFTDEYIRFNPSLRKLPEQLAELESKINTKLQSGGGIAVQEAENNYAAAHQAVATIQRQMTAHKQEAAEYTGQFAKHQALQQELQKLENLKQDIKQRLVDIEVKQRQKYPQVDVIDTASLPSKPIRPDYWLESAIAFAASLALGLLAVWMGDYLRREQPIPSMETVSATQLPHEARQAFGGFSIPQAIYYDPLKVLENDTGSRELSYAETAALFAAADHRTKQIIALLLNGLSDAEIMSLTADCFDLQQQSINIPLSERQLAMTHCTKALLAASGWQAIQSPLEEFDAILTCAAIDGGLFGAEQIKAETLSYTYTLFLIRQGIRLADLTKIIGPVSPSRLLQLGKFSPDGAGLPLEQIDRDYLKNQCEAEKPE
jgi:uncharacterized protein involved in exopolysaccharide biosynthesis